MAYNDHRRLLKTVIANMRNPRDLHWSLATGPIVVIRWRKTHTKGLEVLEGFYTTAIATLASIMVVFDISN